MITPSQRVLTFKLSLFLAVSAIAATTVLGGAFPGSHVRGAASVPAPKVTSITQITHDGFRKANLMADDSQLFVTELPGDHRVIAKVTLPGSERSIVPSPFSNLQALDLSPDHTKLLVSSKQPGSGDAEFWTLPVSSGPPERVGDLTGRDAAWSANGQQLVLAKGSILYLANAKGADVRELYTANGSVFAPRFSADGERIRFTVSNTEQNTTSLWEIGRDGSRLHALLGNWPYKSTACCGSWTADGHYYIFQASQGVPNTATTITTLWAWPDSGRASDEDSAAPVPLTSGPMSFGNASPVRDSRNLWALGVQPAGEVVKFDRSKKKFVPVVAGVSATDLDFSSDGKWVTFVTIPEGTLWRSRANGNDRLQLTSAPERAALPHWSPDGKQIAYVSMQPGESWKISLVPAGGGPSQHILAESGSQIDANWSPDGARLMFGDFAHDAGGLSIRILDFKTHAAVTVPGSQGLFSPRWSPDGRYVAALSPDNTTLKIFDFESQKWSNWLTESAGTVNYPVWSADSEYLYFDDSVNGDESIRRVKVGGSQPELVFVLGSIDRYLGPLGLWAGRAADGSWMFVRDRSTQEVYQLSLVLP